MTKNSTPNNTRRSRKHLIIPIIGAILGILMLLYPVVSTRLHNAEQQRIANSYSAKVSHLDNKETEKILAAADKYNTELAQGLILDPFLTDVAPNSPEYRAYLKQLGGEAIMGQVRVPSAKINLPIYHGTFEDALQKGAGHLFGSSLPIGGKDSHTVITGHTGLQNMTLFDHLPKVKKGDAIYLNVAGRKLKYIVNDISIILPDDTKKLRRVAGKDLITLVTCTPYGINSHRLLVTGERAPLDKEEATKEFVPKPVENPWEWWMIALTAAAGIASLIVLYVIIRLIVAARRRKKEDNETPEATLET
ncbi:class C sortase [Actinomycetaceae bacterium TAE3-ERU4]|nr:class C sortase [Actinomycetaceae bacterium TAE3-ERU4]